MEEKRELMTALTYFTLLQFQPKILQRLEIKLHASSSTSFLDLFRDENDGGMNGQELRDGWIEMGFVGIGRGNYNEGKLKPIWRKVNLQLLSCT